MRPFLLLYVSELVAVERLTQNVGGVLSLTVRFHADRELDDWLLYSHDALHAGRGLTDGKGRIFHGDGTLLASFEQESMIRAMPAAQQVKRENAM